MRRRTSRQAIVPGRKACAVDHEAAQQFRRAGPFRTAAAETYRKLLVREREDDYEGDHNKGDRISVKSFPIDVNTHRTALLFAEVTAKQ
jgi:hypothetical protein